MEKIKVIVESYTTKGRDKEINETVVSDEYWTQHRNFDGSILHVKVTAVQNNTK